MPQVQTIAVIGAGIMGRGIAHAAAVGGYRTILEDLLPNALRKAETGREARFYRLTPLGERQLEDQRASWNRLSAAVTAILNAE